MVARLLLGVASEDLRNQALATFAEFAEEFEVAGVAETTGDLLLGLEANLDIDLVVLDDQLGPLPYLAVIRELVGRVPDLGVVVMTSAPSVATYQSVMDAGGRAVVDSPPTHDEVQERLLQIVDWQRLLRERTGALGVGAGHDRAGRMIAFTGAKGGVGTTTIAIQTALLAAASNPERRVCLIDMDLQQHGVRQFFDLSARRTMSDLVLIADNLTGRNLDEAVTVHPSGVRLLLAPEQAEQSEDINAAVARQILAAAKGHYDLVIVDTGSVVTEANAVAMEFSDSIVMVATPDVPAIRAVQDKAELLNRLQVAKPEDVQLLFNRASPKHEVQPQFGARMTSLTPMKAALPEDYRRLETVVNAMSPPDLEDGPFRRAIMALGRELRLVLAGGAESSSATVSREEKRPSRRRRRGQRDSAGQITIEALVGIVVAVVILLVLIQVTVLGLGAVSAQRAADAAARVGVRGADHAAYNEAARDAVPGFFQVTAQQKGSSNTYRVTLRTPTVVPWLNRPLRAEGTAAEED